MKDVPLFEPPPAPEPVLSHALASHQLGKKEKVSYSAYRAKRHVQCDECVAVLHEAGGKGWSILGAKVARKEESGGRLLLCDPHAEMWKGLDARTAPKRGRGRR